MSFSINYLSRMQNVHSASNLVGRLSAWTKRSVRWGAAFALVSCLLSSANAQAPLNAGGYTQDFNTLAAEGTSTALPTGWALLETGTGGVDNAFMGNDGSDASGGAYSYGSLGSSDRALGVLRSSTTAASVGVFFKNNTGVRITSLSIAFTGEQWRLGNFSREDRLDLEFSVSATNLSNGTWSNVSPLGFTAPVTSGSVGALNGNGLSNQTYKLFTLTGLNINAGETFAIRWTDFDATGEDDALAIDDVLIIPNPPVSTPPKVNLVQNGVTQSNNGNFNFGSVLFGGFVDVPFVLQNQSGTSVLNVNSLSVSGNGFSLVSNPFPASIAANSSMTFTVRYTANVSGSVSGMLTINSNDPASPFMLNLTASAAGVVNIALGGSYVQDFNNLPTAGQTPFANVAPTGWYGERTGSGVNVIAGSTGSDLIGNLYSFGSTGSNDRALGSVGSASTTVGDLYWGVLVFNNGASTIPTLNVKYVGEQWRNGGSNTVQDMTFAYKKSSTPLTSLQGAGWTQVPALTFNSLQNSGAATALNGNLSANRTTLTTSIPGIDLAPGEYILFRWFDANHLGNDHGLSADDVLITAPSPAPTISLSNGAGALGNGGLFNYPSVVLDASSQTDFTITNTGSSGNLVINNANITGDFSTTAIFPITLGPGQSQTVTVMYMPTATGMRNGSIAFNSNDGATPVFTLNLSGMATGYVSLNNAYLQDFNSLPASGSSIWDNNNILGWYSERTGTGNTIIAGDGSGATGGLYSFGTTNTGDRALGTLANTTTGDIFTGVLVKNTSGFPITSLNIGLTAEQWRRSGANASQSVTFAYKVMTTTPMGTLQGAGWTDFQDLNFSSPQSNGSAVALDGNATANRVMLSAQLAVALQPNQYIMLRWLDVDNASTDHAFGMDDFSINAQLSAPNIAVLQGGNPFATNNTYDFGTAIVDQIVNATFTVRNTGSLALTINSATAVGSDFALSTPLPITIAPGMAMDIVVRYLPTATAIRTGSITLISNAGNLPNYVLNFKAFATGWVAFGPGQSYAQNFSALPATGFSVWDNNNINGWYASRTAAGALEIFASDGSGAQSGFYSYGAAGSNDRSLGSLAAVQTGDFYYGVLLKNTGSAPIANLNVGYFLEQWRLSGANVDNLIGFSYKVSTTPFGDLMGTGWTNVASLNGTSPQALGSAGALDGNLAANRAAVNGSFPVTVNQGEYLMIRFFDADSPNIDHALAIDDFKVIAATPGPVIQVSQNANIIADGATYDYGASIVGAQKDVAFTIMNMSDFSPLTVSSASLIGDYTVLGTPFPLTVAPGGMANITVRFTPTANGVNAGSITLNSDDPANPTYMINFTAVSTAYVPLTNGGTYMQDFNSLPTSGSMVWNNTNIAGWYSERTGTGNTVIANDGSGTGSGLYSFGNDSNRALGTVGSGTTGDFFYGVLIRNVGTATINELNISYIAEQWRLNGQNTTQTVGFSYMVSSMPIVDEQAGMWTNFNALNFDSPQPTGPAGPLDGHAAANRVSLNANLQTPVLPGQYIFLRWFDPDHNGTDHGLAIDDFMISAPTGGPVIMVSHNGMGLSNGQSFDLQTVIESSLDVNFWVKNTAQFDSLHVSAINVGGAEYSLVNPMLPWSIAPGDSAMFTIRFAPTAVGPAPGSVEIVHDDMAQNPFIFTLKGLGTGYVSLKQGNTYTQDFNGLINSGTGPWDNNNILGWYSSHTGNVPNDLTANDGTILAGGLYSFGMAGSPDRSLGNIGSGQTGNYYTGVLIKNTGSQPIQALDISYIAEQWTSGGGASAQTVKFSYRVSTTPFNDLVGGTWTDFNPLAFDSPIFGQPAGPLDGNDPANEVDLQKVLMLTLNPGEFVMLRWYDPNHSGADNALSIDDLFIKTPVPASQINVQYNGMDLITNATQSFGVAVVDQMVDVTFAIQNVSMTKDLVVDAMTIEPLGTAEFMLMNFTLPVTVAPGDFVNFVIRYTPAQIGIRTAKLTIHSNDPDTQNFILNLEGNATGYVSLSNGTSYTQNFNSLPIDFDEQWDNNNIIGWYAQTVPATDPLDIKFDDGSTNTGGFYSYGTTDAPDRALGCKNTDAFGDFYYGLLIKNVGTTNIDTFDMTYIAEQWRRMSNQGAQRVDFSYKKSGTPFSDLNTAGWTDFDPFDFKAVNTTGATSAIDGNVAANRANKAANLYVNLAPGEYIMLRWFDPNHPGTDHGLAIDDFTLFAPSDCNVPANLIVTAGTVTQNSATMQWDNPPITLAGSFNLRYRVFGAPTWTVINDINGNDLQLIDLQSSTTYEVQIQGICAQNQTSEWSLSSNFTTLDSPGACLIPGGIFLSQFMGSTSQVLVHWDDVPGATCYQVQYRRAGVTAWKTVPGPITSDDNPILLDLLSSTDYEFRIRTRCGACNAADTNVSAFSPIIAYSTPLDCQFDSFTINGGADALTACKNVDLALDGDTQENFSYQWFKNDVAIIGGVSRVKTYNAFEPGTYSLRVRVGNCPDVFSNEVVVTVKPGIDSLIILSKTDVSCPGANDGMVNVLAKLGSGAALDLITYSMNGVDFQSSNVFMNLPEGTYTFTALDPDGCTATNTATVAGPTPPEISFVTVNASNKATVNWTFAATGFVRFDLQYRVLGAVGWTTFSNITGTSRQLTGLQAGTTYEVRVRARCANGLYTGYSPIVTFNTPQSGGGGTCQVPGGVFVNVIDATEALVKWNPVTAAKCYVVSYGQVGSPTQEILVAHPQTSLVLVGLQPGLFYGVRVRTNCTECSATSGTRSAFSSAITFNTAGKVADENAEAIAPALESNLTDLRVYPNPSNGAFEASFDATEAGELEYTLTDVTGKTVVRATAQTEAGPNRLAIDATGQAAGIYLLQIRQGETARTLKVIVR